jgi:hypothetical protein
MASLTDKKVDSTVRAALTEAGAALQTKNFIAYDREPLLTEIPEQGFVLATVAGTVYIYARLGNNRYKAAMTLV